MTRSELLERAKPILLNTEMVRAIQDGTKTVTRRVIKGIPETAHMFLGINPTTQKAEFLCVEIRNGACVDWEVGIKLPFQIGDILYVRETWFYEGHMHDITAGDPDLPSGRYSFRYIYKANNPDYPVDIGVGADGWHPSIHMPKEAARIFLRVTNVRVERLQDIDDDGVVAEGLEIGAPFDELWDSTVKKSDRDMYGWAANPWVWVIEFEVMEVIK